MKTHYEFIESNSGKKESVILTTGLLGAIDRSKSLKGVVEYFKEQGYNILMFDMFAHGKSEGNIEDYTLSKVYDQVLEMIKFLEEKGKEVKILYGVSASSLPVLKAGLDKKIEKIILRSPAIEMYAKRNRELGLDKMLEWKKNGIIKLWDDYHTGEPIRLKYNFIRDTLDNFHCLNLDNNFSKILLGSGREDEEVPYFELQALAKRYKNIKLKLYKNEGHSLSEETVKEFIKDIENFLNRV